MNERSTGMLYGAALGGGFALLLFLLLFGGACLQTQGQTAELEFLGWSLYVLVPLTVGALMGAIAGAFAAGFETKRFRKTLGVACLLYLASAFLIAEVMVVGDLIVTPREQTTLEFISTITIETLQLALMGAILMSPMGLPLLALFAYILERLTREA